MFQAYPLLSWLDMLNKYMPIKQALAIHTWNNSKQNKDENICQCVQGNRSDTGLTRLG